MLIGIGMSWLVHGEEHKVRSLRPTLVSSRILFFAMQELHNEGPKPQTLRGLG